MRIIAISIILLLFSVYGYAQAEASNWYFGSNAGIRFNTNGSTTNLNDGQLNTDEGCTTISDAEGNLLFYTDGITVWNRLHQPMPNANPTFGTQLFGDPSSTQSALVVPKPDDPDIYYIFTVDTPINNDPDRGLNYSTVNLNLEGGLGDIVAFSKNVNLLRDSSEKISAVLKDCISKSIWVITFASTNGAPNQNFDTFHAYEVSNTGVSNTPVSSTFNVKISDPRGYLKLSPDGTKLACANSTSGLFLYDFDSNTGVVSNQNKINIGFNPNGKTQSAYGVEFSQNSDILYVSAYFQTSQQEFNNPSSQYGSLLQYDLTSANISNSEIVIDDRQMYRGALQLAPNGKIYRAMSITYPIGSPFLSVINNPNQLGTNCDYEHNAVQLSRNSRQGLPPFIASFFAENINITQKETNITYLPLCHGESYTLIAEDIPDAKYTWFLNDVVLPENNFDLDITVVGEYKVIIQTVTGDCGGLLEGKAIVDFFNSPVANSVEDIMICDDDNNGSFLFDLATLNNEILGSQDPFLYNVKYFKSLENAELDRNEISNLFEASRSSQTIFIRLGLNENNTCFDTTKSFNIQVFDTPIVNTVKSSKICDIRTFSDVDVTNGIRDIDLRQFDNDILGNQNSSDYTVTYHKTLIDAENGNSLNYNYKNLTPFSETIFARIQNNLNPQCFSISDPIIVTIDPLPEFSNTTLIQCDEDDVTDGVTNFNLLEANNILTNSSSNRSVKYFYSSSDASNAFGEIKNPENFRNSFNNQILFAQVIDNITGCFDIAEITLEVSTTRINDYNAIPACDELNSEDGINTFDLNVISTSIQSDNGISFPVTFYPTFEDALLEENELNSEYENINPYSQIIYARVENNNACYGISKVYLTINRLPEIETEDSTFYCLSKFPETKTINAGLLNGFTSDFNYNWSNGDTTYETIINSPGIYSVEVTNVNNCAKTRTIMVESSLATFNTIPYEVNDGLPNNSIIVLATIQGSYLYALYDESNTIIYRDFQSNNIFENVFPGIYTIRIKDSNNECGTILKEVSIVGFPKFFTPNNDSFNDTWQVYGVSDMFQRDSKILIYDRYGKLVKQLNPLGLGWDGTFNGQIMPSDDYWFSVTLQDGRTFKNHFTLKR